MEAAARAKKVDNTSLKEASVELRERLSIVAGLAGAALLLVVGALAGARVSPTNAGTMAESCSFDSVVVTADQSSTPCISDTLPGDTSSRIVYFSKPVSSGVITVAVILTNPGTSCYLWASPAFSVTDQRQVTLTFPALRTEMTFTVGSRHGPTVTTVLTSSKNITGSISPPHQVVTLNFVLDNAPPTSTARSPIVHYGLGPISVSWEAGDAGSGVATAKLYYVPPTGTGWLDSGLVQAGMAGRFYFTPTSLGAYTFTTQAEDHVGNREARAEKTWTLVTQARVFLPSVLLDFPPVWRQATNTDNIHFRTPSGCGTSTWYAGTSDNGIWQSTDNARSWIKIATFSKYPYPVVADPNNCNQMFGSVWGTGIYSITGNSVQQVNTGLGELSVYGLAISGTTLYAGTNTQGVYKALSTNVIWQAVNAGIDDRRIRTIALAGNRVYAGARACTLYVSENGGASWSKQTVLTSGCNDAQIWSVSQVKAVRYAGLGMNKGLYYDAGSGWQQVAAIPDTTIYGLAYGETDGHLYVSTDGSGIYRCDVDGTGAVQMCSQYNQGLATLNIREIKIHNDLLLAGSDDGLWYLPLIW